VLGVLGLLGSLGVGLMGCGGGRGGSGVPNDPWIVGVALRDEAEPRQAQMKADLELAASGESRVKLLFRDAAGDAAAQDAQVREFIQQGVALIIVNPVDAQQAAAPIAKAMAERIPVIALDSDVEGEPCTCFIGSDNEKIGEGAGRVLRELLVLRGKVVELKGPATSPLAPQRHAGFLRGLRGSEIEVIFDPECSGREEDAQREMAAALALFPQIDGVFAYNDVMAHGAYLAAKEEGKGRHRSIRGFVGIGALPEQGLKYLREGSLTATVEYPTGGAKAIETAVRILRGDVVSKRLSPDIHIFTEENRAKGGDLL
jgi:ribose transport system substrate-binding protein